MFWRESPSGDCRRYCPPPLSLSLSLAVCVSSKSLLTNPTTLVAYSTHPAICCLLCCSKAIHYVVCHKLFVCYHQAVRSFVRWFVAKPSNTTCSCACTCCTPKPWNLPLQLFRAVIVVFNCDQLCIVNKLMN